MPELIITAGTDRRPIHSINDLDEWSYVTLYGRMYFPNNDKKFEEYCEASTAFLARDEFRKRFEEAAKSELKKQLPNQESGCSWSGDDWLLAWPTDDWLSANIDKLPYPKDIAATRIHLSHLEQLVSQGKPIRAGLRAGDVLVTLKRIFDNPKKVRGREPSLDQAFAVSGAMNRLKAKSMRTAWKEFRSVSHLWGARCLLPLPPKGEGRELFSPIFLCEILHLGEALLSFAEQHVTGSGTQSKPILRRNDAWHLPKHFELGKKSTAIAASLIGGLPHLNDEEVKALRHYRAEDRQ